MFFYIVLTPISTTPVFKVPAIRVNTTNSTYTFTSVRVPILQILFAQNSYSPSTPTLVHIMIPEEWKMIYI